jgi:putative addiction module component (TIGR02574 family)
MDTHQIRLNIPLSFTQLLDVARQLSPKEKIRLGSVLWDEANENEIDISEAHKQEVRRRIIEMEEHPENRLTWKEIESKLRL